MSRRKEALRDLKDMAVEAHWRLMQDFDAEKMREATNAITKIQSSVRVAKAARKLKVR